MYLVPIITTFYFVPSIQYVLQTKQTEQMLGTQDLCYHNFRCSRPFWIFDDFNHVVSNISYALFGLFFMIIVKNFCSEALLISKLYVLILERGLSSFHLVLNRDTLSRRSRSCNWSAIALQLFQLLCNCNVIILQLLCNCYATISKKKNRKKVTTRACGTGTEAKTNIVFFPTSCNKN